MKKGNLILLISAMALTSASAAIISAQKSNRPVEANAEGEIHVSTWDGLKDAIDDADDGETIVLDADIISDGGKSNRIKINKKKNLTIDLDGHTVNRNRDSSSSDGHAFEISGSSTVTIKSTSTQALVTGGYAENGGAVNIHDGSTVTFNNIKFDGNHASSDGGAIYARGVLNMANCVISNNVADDTGGAIFTCDDCDFDLDHVTITLNTAKNDGGAINAHIDNTSYIKNSTITKNKSLTEDGGAISFDSDGDLLIITDSIINENEALKGNGGAIENEDGQVDIKHTTISQNTAKNGGAIYADDDINIDENTSGSTISLNYAKENGGAIYVNNSDVIIYDGAFNGNKAALAGGAIFIKGDMADIRGGTFTNNEAVGDSGGAVYMDKNGKLILSGGTFTDNVATSVGGAICFPKKADKFELNGTVTIQNNGASLGPDVYLYEGGEIEITGSLAGSRIGIGMPNPKAVFKDSTFTKNYDKYNKVNEEIVSPSTYFFSSVSGFDAELDEDGEAYLKEATAGSASDPYLSFPFISDGQNVRRDSKHLSGNNWMSGISGERYLNEINIPGTHDTAMRRVGTEAGGGSWANWGTEYAITQKRYIPEQFEGGVRYLDIRINSRIVLEENWVLPNEVGDDGVHLWQCHGKTGGGTYWAADAEGNLMHTVMVLDWARKFLARNPSECIIMGFGDECYYSECVPTIWARLRTILNDYKAQYPDIFYLKNDSVDEPYDHMPQLKEVRGKILLEVKSGYGLGCFTNYNNLPNIKTAGQKTDKSAFWDKRR